MQQEIIRTDQAPQPIGAFSQARVFSNLMFVSGQLGDDPVTGSLVSDNIEDQAAQAMKNLRTIVEAAGSSMSNVLKCVVFVTDMTHFSSLNSIYRSFFDGTFPARSFITVKQLPKGGLFEVEAIVSVPPKAKL